MYVTTSDQQKLASVLMPASARSVGLTGPPILRKEKMRLEDDESIGITRCPYCGAPKQIPCQVDDNRRISWKEPDRQYVRSHKERIRAAVRLGMEDPDKSKINHEKSVLVTEEVEIGI